MVRFNSLSFAVLESVRGREELLMDFKHPHPINTSMFPPKLNPISINGLGSLKHTAIRDVEETNTLSSFFFLPLKNTQRSHPPFPLLRRAAKARNEEKLRE